MRTTTGRTSRGRSTTNGEPARTGPWLWLTAPMAVLLAIAAGSELLVDGIFRGDELNFIAQGVG